MDGDNFSGCKIATFVVLQKTHWMWSLSSISPFSIKPSERGLDCPPLVSRTKTHFKATGGTFAADLSFPTNEQTGKKVQKGQRVGICYLSFSPHSREVLILTLTY